VATPGGWQYSAQSADANILEYSLLPKVFVIAMKIVYYTATTTTSTTNYNHLLR